MAEAKDIKALLKEAQLYQTQGLLSEAKARYRRAIEMAEASTDLTAKEAILGGIEKKLASLEAAAYRIEKKTNITEISPRDKDLIKRLFSTATADDRDTATLEGAVALAKFAQFDRAIAEFEDLLEASPLRIVAAKHILRCHMALRSLHDPVAQFQKWVVTGYFGKEELSEISTFMERTYGLSATQQPGGFRPVTGAAAPPATDTDNDHAQGRQQPATESKGLGYDPYAGEYVDALSEIGASSVNNSRANGAPPADDGIVDIIGSPRKKPTPRYEDIESDKITDYVDYISGVGIPLPSGGTARLSVNLQTGNVINLIVSSGMKEVLPLMKKGALLEKVHLDSPISSNTGNCLVVSVARIEQGPKRGDYSVDLRIADG